MRWLPSDLVRHEPDSKDGISISLGHLLLLGREAGRAASRSVNDPPRHVPVLAVGLDDLVEAGLDG
jgi:hypothetical protein